jgi:hypothetical protein
MPPQEEVPTPAIQFSAFERVIPDAYHGTDLNSAMDIVSAGFRMQDNPDLLLGRGVYFYESCHECAWNWAVTHRKKPPAVLRCVIGLGRCLDFSNSRHARALKEYYEAMKTRLASSPVTRSSLQKWTQALAVNLLAGKLQADTVRAPYFTRVSLTPVGNISIDSPIVICVRRTEKISSTILEPPLTA